MAIEPIRTSTPRTTQHTPAAPAAAPTASSTPATAATPTKATTQRVNLFTEDTFETAGTRSAPVALSVASGAGGDDTQWDGYLVGANGQKLPPGTPLSDLDPVVPDGGARNNETIIQVNGMQQDVGEHADDLQETADVTGSKVIGIHNSTQGFWSDTGQAIGDKGWGSNPATDTLATTVIQELEAGRDVHIIGYSQGALITSGALRQVEDYYKDQGYDDEQVRAKMSNIKVETFGGAARTYPDGPQYVHYVNYADPIATNFGLGANPSLHHADAGGGDNAKVVKYTDFSGIWGDPLAGHDYGRYLSHRQDFDTAYNDR